jgi:hypothetical protein
VHPETRVGKDAGRWHPNGDLDADLSGQAATYKCGLRRDTLPPNSPPSRGLDQGVNPMAKRTTKQTKALPVRLRGLGVGTHFPSANWDVDKLLPLIRDLGVSVVRQDFHWEAIEKTKGHYAVPDDMRHWFDAVTGAGIKVVVLLSYGNKLYENPLDPQAYANYAAWMARNFREGVAAFEIWNEPTNFYFLKQYGGAWSGRDDALWTVKFGELVRTAAAAMKKAGPSAPIIHNLENTPWLYSLRRSAQDFADVDGIDVHPYPIRFPPETIPFGGPEIEKRDGAAVADERHSLLSLLDFHSKDCPRKYLGRALECWVGEFGYTTYSPLKDGFYAGFSEQAQAAYLVRGLVMGLAYGVKAWCLYDLIDDSPNPHDAESRFGLLADSTRGYKPKPSYYAIQRVARLLGEDWQAVDQAQAQLEVNVRPLADNGDIWQGPQPTGFVQVNGPEVRWFRVGRDYVTILWRAGRFNGELAPVIGKMNWPQPPEAAEGVKVTVQDLVSGEDIGVVVSREGSSLTVAGVPVGGAPIAIRWIEVA